MIGAIYFRRYLAPIAFLLIFASAYFDYRNNSFGLPLFDFYANNPNHVLAQTLLKCSLIFTNSPLILLFGVLSLGFLNVRSTILSLVSASLYIHAKALLRARTWLLIGAGTLVIIYAFSSTLNIDELLDRLVFKNRSFDSAVENLSSGRSEIYAYYVNYLANQTSVIDWAIGKGPIWTDASQFEFSAHNDILNLITAFGIGGLAATVTSYYIFFQSLPKYIRTPAIISFLALFITNGVVFHQSNILFALLYYFSATPRQRQRN